MFYHNTVTRTQHLSTNGGAWQKASFDQQLAHSILSEWAQRVRADPENKPGDAKAHIEGVIRDLDNTYAKVLSLRLSDEFRPMVTAALAESEEKGKN